MKNEFSTLDIVKALGVTRERLRDWINQSFINPHKAATGHGSKAIFTINEVYGIALFRFLVESGFNRSLAAQWTSEFTKELNKSIQFREISIAKFIKTKDNPGACIWLTGNDLNVVKNVKHTEVGMFNKEEDKLNIHDWFYFNPAMPNPKDVMQTWQMIFFINLRHLFNEVDEALSKL